MEEAYTSKSLSEGHLPKPIPSSFSNLSLKVADERRSRPFPGTFIYQQGRQAGTAAAVPFATTTKAYNDIISAVCRRGGNDESSSSSISNTLVANELQPYINIDISNPYSISIRGNGF